MNKGIIAAILSFLLYLSNFLGGGFGQPVQQPNPPIGQQSYYVLGQKGQIIADKITVRLSPNTESELSGSVVKGQEVTILDKSDNWYKIRSTVGLEGWIPEYSVTINKIEPKNIDKVILGYYPAGDHDYESLLEHSTQLTSISP